VHAVVKAAVQRINPMKRAKFTNTHPDQQPTERYLKDYREK
jgi:hypothetical protein